MLELLSAFGSHGVSGLVIGVQFFWIWRQEKRFQDLNVAYRAETDARVEDAKSYTEMALSLQERVIKAVETLGGILDDSNGVDSTTPRREAQED